MFQALFRFTSVARGIHEAHRWTLYIPRSVDRKLQGRHILDLRTGVSSTSTWHVESCKISTRCSADCRQWLTLARDRSGTRCTVCSVVKVVVAVSRRIGISSVHLFRWSTLPIRVAEPILVQISSCHCLEIVNQSPHCRGSLQISFQEFLFRLELVSLAYL